jgi:septal ring factor EnvC (AmiA/AmiB activator)
VAGEGGGAIAGKGSGDLERGGLAARIPADAANDAELARLERAVRALADRFGTLNDENAELRRRLRAGEERVAELETEVRRLNQTRRDVAKRVDDLIVQIEQLEGRVSVRAD